MFNVRETYYREGREYRHDNGTASRLAIVTLYNSDDLKSARQYDNAYLRVNRADGTGRFDTYTKHLTAASIMNDDVILSGENLGKYLKEEDKEYIILLDGTKHEITEYELLHPEKSRELIGTMVLKSNGMFDVLESVYPGRWDFTKVYEKPAIAIHFPEVEITNSKKHTHTIKDLYVFFTIDVIAGKLMDSWAYGWRTFYTADELAAQYAHSHLSSSAMVHPDEFCFGSSEIGTIVYELTQKYDADKFYLLLYFLETYVAWESLEGGPYREIEYIGKVGATVDNTRTESASRMNDYAYQLIHSTSYRPNLQFVEVPKPEFKVMEDDELRQALLSIHCPAEGYNAQTDTYYTVSGGPSREYQNAIEYINDEKDEGSYPMFKGEKLVPTYSEPNDQEDLSKHVLRPKKRIVDHVIAYLEREINKNYVLKLLDK